MPPNYNPIDASVMTSLFPECNTVTEIYNILIFFFWTTGLISAAILCKYNVEDMEKEVTEMELKKRREKNYIEIP